MSVLAIVDYATAVQYKGGNLSTKYNGKKHKLYLKLTCDDYTLKDAIELAKISSNIVAVDYQGYETSPEYLSLTTPSAIYITRQFEFGNNITEEDVSGTVNSVPFGVTPIIHLPEDFKNLQFVYRMCKKYPRVRFTGGKLFNIEGVRIGCVGVDILDKLGIKYDTSSYFIDGVIDVLEVVNINDLDIDISSKPDKPVKKSTSSASKKTTSSSPKKSKPVNSFASLLLGRS